MKYVEVKFPLMDDISINLPKKHSMVQLEETLIQAVKAVFFIISRES